MRDHQRGNLLPLQNAVYIVGDVQARLIIQRRKRLVQQQDIRPCGQCADERHALAHAAGKLARVFVAEFIQAVGFEQLPGAGHVLRRFGAADLQPEQHIA